MPTSLTSSLEVRLGEFEPIVYGTGQNKPCLPQISFDVVYICLIGLAVFSKSRMNVLGHFAISSGPT
jgi:hypothetical protein